MVTINMKKIMNFQSIFECRINRPEFDDGLSGSGVSEKEGTKIFSTFLVWAAKGMVVQFTKMGNAGEGTGFLNLL